VAKRRFRLLERQRGAAEPGGSAPADAAAPARERDEAGAEASLGEPRAAGAPPLADAAPAPEPGAPAARARRLEREGTPRLDERGPADTDFCRHCRFENRAGAARCLNCGSPIGGPDQEAFDAEMRAWREQRRRVAAAEGLAAARTAGAAEADAEPSARPQAAAPGAPPSLADLDVARLLREAERHEPGFGTVIAAGVLVGCIFALVSIPLRWIFSSVHGGFSAGGVVELLLLVGVTAGIYAAVRRPLARL